MSDIRDQRELEELRQRLYARGPVDTGVERHTLTDTSFDVAEDWNTGQQPKAVTARSYRTPVLIASIAIFLLVAIASAAYFYFGNSRISGDNIAFNIAGNNNISGGETVSFQIGVTNQNSVAIEGASLIVTYPEGTRTVTEPVRNVREERIDVGMLGPGEAKNIQLQVAVYGKQNQQAEIKATLEYRLVGSDGVFYKEIEPFAVRIISSPIILQVESVRRVSAGQPVQITLQVKSNTNKPLQDVLITAQYPNSFTYQTAVPEPLYNQHVWKISKLNPEETETIIINGTIAGLTNESIIIDFMAGAAQTDNEFIVGSLLAEARAEFMLEQPFIATTVAINGDTDGSAILEKDRAASVQVSIKNTLSEPVYDMVIEVVPSGNAVRADSIKSQQGFFDSNKNLLRFDVSNSPELVEVRAAESRSVTFTLEPALGQTTASFNVLVNVYAKRLSEPNAQQQIVGTVSAEARYTSQVSLQQSLRHVSGPLPPKVGQSTRYTVTLKAGDGTNNLRNAVVTTTLPSYVQWQAESSGDGTISFNSVSRQLQWNVGDIPSRTFKEHSFDITLLPSLSQRGSVPVLVGNLSLSAVDRFTNAPVTTTVGEINGQISGLGENSGMVTE